MVRTSHGSTVPHTTAVVIVGIVIVLAVIVVAAMLGRNKGDNNDAGVTGAGAPLGFENPMSAGGYIPPTDPGAGSGYMDVSAGGDGYTEGVNPTDIDGGSSDDAEDLDI